MTDGRTWKVGEVAVMAHLTVRTLHHWNEIGLLEPSGRTGAGHRLYDEADLGRLQEVLLYRELGFSLERIAAVLDDPAVDRRSALRAQRDLLVEKRRRTDALIRAVDRALEALEKGRTMTSDEIVEGFDAFADAPEAVREHQRVHGGEAKERWGDRDAYRESMRRVRDFTRADWLRVQEEGEAAEERMAELLRAGADPEGPEAMAGAEALRAHIANFYPCGYRMHAGLADMYEADDRFRAHYEARQEGLTEFVAAAIRANALRAWDRGEE